MRHPGFGCGKMLDDSPCLVNLQHWVSVVFHSSTCRIRCVCVGLSKLPTHERLSCLSPSPWHHADGTAPHGHEAEPCPRCQAFGTPPVPGACPAPGLVLPAKLQRISWHQVTGPSCYCGLGLHPSVWPNCCMSLLLCSCRPLV